MYCRNIGYDEFCYNDSRTFNNRSYNFIDICKKSKECISAYRIKDGYQDCADSNDELQVLDFRTHVQTYNVIVFDVQMNNQPV